MAKKEDPAKWYEVLEQSYIGDRLYAPGDRVYFEGEAGPNLRLLKAGELKEVDPQKTDDDLLIDREKEVTRREADVDKREKDLVKREQEIQAREQDQEKRDEAARDDKGKAAKLAAE